MSVSNPYDALFEPVKIGPVTARNRFYQVPHCCGLGHVRPQAHAAMRGMKAEGGWAVVSTEEAEIHPTSDLSPYAEQRIWDERDIPALKLMTDAVHAKGALAAIELVHNGSHAMNYLSRAPLLAPSDITMEAVYPKQARAMSKADIQSFRQWHRSAARRAMQAGFDIIYVYAGHRMTLAHHFLLPQYNKRHDEYGGSLENRARLLRQLLEDTKEEVGSQCAVAFRFAVDEMLGDGGMTWQKEGQAIVKMLAEIPDLWDVNVSNWANDSATSRFEKHEGYQTPYIEFVKKVTNKPVVAVGRITSPDYMLSMVKDGIVDFIGAARPSIADPFIPNKIRAGRIDEIRECIGCNVCVSSDGLGVPIRCTQNPTIAEEWRRGWHPEKIAIKGQQESALVIGGGAAGLECAMQLARRGYEVTLAEARPEMGGRILDESSLLGLSAWKRVLDYRLFDIQRRANINMYNHSHLSAEQVLEFGVPNVFVATGASWRLDGVGRSRRDPITSDQSLPIYTPDDVMQSNLPDALLMPHVLLFDDDLIYMGGVMAQHLVESGYKVSVVTSASVVSPFAELTLEQPMIQKRLLDSGVTIIANHAVIAVQAGEVHLVCNYTGRIQKISASGLLLVTEKQRHSTLYDALMAMDDPGLQHLELIGDAANPGLLADAVYSGHLAARNFEEPAGEVEQQQFRREIIALD